MIRQWMLLVLAVTFFDASANEFARTSASYLKRSDGSEITYYLEKNKTGKADKTLVIFLQGSGCNSVAHKSWIDAFGPDFIPGSDLLLVEKRGITAALPFDENPSREDCPASYIERDSPQQRVDDIRLVVRRLLKTNRYHQVLVLGASEGAEVAAMFSAQTGMTNAVIVINVGGRWFINDLLHNIAMTTPVESRDEAESGFKDFANQVLTQKPFHMVSSNHGYRWWHNVLSIDMESVLSQIKVPVLIIQSQKDKSVNPQESKAMVQRLYQQGHKFLTYKTYPDLNHALFSGDDAYKGAQVFEFAKTWALNILSKNKKD